MSISCCRCLAVFLLRKHCMCSWVCCRSRDQLSLEIGNEWWKLVAVKAPQVLLQDLGLGSYPAYYCVSKFCVFKVDIEILAWSSVTSSLCDIIALSKVFLTCRKKILRGCCWLSAALGDLGWDVASAHWAVLFCHVRFVKCDIEPAAVWVSILPAR